MSIIFDPSKIVEKMAPKRKIRKLLSQRLSLKKAALSFVDKSDLVSRKSISEVALKVIDSYKERIKEDKSLKPEILDDPKQLIQRIQNHVIFEAHEHIKDKYRGETATWLPSSAEEARPEHQLNYGKTYVIGVGIDGVEPGDEYGCQCGVLIHTDDQKLEL